jgi:ribosome-binding factor A
MGKRQRSGSNEASFAVEARTARISELIREEINTLLRNDIQDPHLAGVEITMVEMMGDSARLWFLSDGDEDRLPALDRAKGYMRHQLAEALDLKRTPDLRFRRDPATRFFALEKT